SRVKDSPSARFYQAYARLSAARVAGRQGNITSGLTAVAALEDIAPGLQNPSIETQLWHVKSELLARAGRLEESEEALLHLTKLGDEARQSEPSAADRAAMARRVAEAVDLLADHYLMRGNATDAWRIWTQYNACFMTVKPEPATAELIYASLPSGP